MVKLSIVCITYNHVRFIRQALEGFVKQKTNFKYEVLIHDDASTDGTAEIIKEYANQYPNIIKPVLQTENQWAKGVNASKEYLWPAISGEYVALCEGDDYWLDENKLQKQVDFLDAHKEYSVCFHPVKVIWEDNSSPESVFPTPRLRFYKKTLELPDLLKRNFIQTNSVVYRWCLKGREDLFPPHILPGDWFLHLLHAQNGKIGFLPEVMSVYRRHAGGVWTGAGQADSWFLNCAVANLHFYNAVQNQFHCDKNAAMVELMGKTINAYLRMQMFDRIKQLATLYPELYAKSLEQTSTKEHKKYQKYKKISKILGLGIIALLLKLFI